MTLSQNSRNRINLVIAVASILAWVVLLVNPGHIMSMEHCHVSASGPSAASLDMLLQMNPLLAQLTGWGLMVVAMMLPKLTLPIQTIYLQNFRHYRFVCASLFVLGYMAAWMAAGIFMVAAIIGLNLLMPLSFIPAIAVSIIAVIWQFSPLKQRFLNLGHDHRPLSAFGWAAFRDALGFGIRHGLYCIGAGWALMLFPMLLPVGHNIAMIVVTFIMISEHLEHPASPRWHFKLRLRLLKAAIAQAKIKMKRNNSPDVLLR